MASAYRRKGRPTYYVSWIDAGGTRREKSARTTDKRTAERIAGKLEADARLRAEGVIDASLDRIAAQNRRPISEHVADYMAWCERAKHASGHVANKRAHLNAVISETGIEHLSDLTPDRLAANIADMTIEKRVGTDDDGKPVMGSEPASARTRNVRRAVWIAFYGWLVTHSRTDRNPFNVVPKADERLDRRRVRRPLTDDELAELIDVARKRDADLNADPKYPHGESRRALWYQMAFYAGLRRGDLCRLRWSDIDLDAGTLTISDGKAKRDDVIPLHPALASELAAYRPAMAHPAAMTQRVFPEAVTNRTRQLDFERAGIKADAEGRVPDLHSLRATLATALARQGVAPQVAQRIMRHSDYRTTTRHYTRLSLLDTSGAIETLDAIGTPQAASEATGTDDEPVRVGGGFQRNFRRAAHGTGRDVAGWCGDDDDAGDDGVRTNPDGSGVYADICGCVLSAAEVERTGIEPATPSLQSHEPPSPKGEFTGVSGDGVAGVRAFSGTPTQDSGSGGVADPDLARVVAAWTDLPPAIRRAVLALIDTTR